MRIQAFHPAPSSRLPSIHHRLLRSIHAGVGARGMEDTLTKRTRMTGLLGGLLMAVTIASMWAQGTIAAEASLPADVGDLSNASTVEIKDNSGAVVLRGHFVEIPEDDDDLERKATLAGSGVTAKATGEAEVEVSKTDNRLDQEVEVSVSNLAPGATYAVFIDAKQLGTFQTNQNGQAELELTTARANSQ